MTKNKIIATLFLTLFSVHVFAAALSWLNPPEIDIGLEGNNEDFSALISANGRYVAFGSRSSNLVIDDTNITNDIFIRDLQSDDIKLVTSNSSGVQISSSTTSRPTNNGDQIAIISRDENLPNRPISASFFDDFLYIKEMQTGNIHTPLFAGVAIQTLRNGKVFISSSGQFIYFTSLVDLVANDTNTKSDVYIYDRSDSSFQLVSINSSGVATGNAELLSISNNGRYVTYEADDGSPGASSEYGYVRDLNFSTTVMYTVDNNGDPVNDSTDSAEVSNNGIVYFCSPNDTIVAGDTNDLDDIFVYNAGVVTLFPFPNLAGGITDFGCSFRSKIFVNNTDTKFYFYHFSNQIDPSISNDTYDKMIFVNLVTQQSTIVNQLNNELIKIDSFHIDTSNNLNDVVFISTSTANITDIDSIRAKTLHYSTQNNQFDVVPVAVFSPQTQNSSAGGVVSEDLNWVVYSTSANNVLENNTPVMSTSTLLNLYLLNKSTSNTTRIAQSIVYGHDMSPNGRYVVFSSNFSQGATPIELDNAYLFLYDRNDNSYSQIVTQVISPRVNNDGNIVFFSKNSTLVANDNNDEYDVFIYDRGASSVQRISTDSNGNDANGRSQYPDIAGSGNSTWIVFESDASDLIAADNNGFNDIFMMNWPAGLVSRISEISGIGGNSYSQQAKISSDTTTIAFVTGAENLIGEVGTDGQVAVYDRVLNSLSIVSHDYLGILQADSFIFRAFPSSTGRFIAFQSEATLVSNDVPEGYPESDVYVFDRQENQIIRMTQYDNGDNYNSGSTLLDLAVDTSQSIPLIATLFTNKDFLINDYFDLNIAENGERPLYLMQSGGDGQQLQVSVSGDGTVTGNLGLNCSDNCSQTYVLGQTISLLATADVETTFIHWQGDVCHNSTALTCEIYINSDKSVEAVFTIHNDAIFNNGFEN